MRRYHALLLTVWREACRHIEISASAATITAALTERLPLERVIVRRLDMPHACLETVAIAASPDSSESNPAFPGRTHLNAEELSRLVAWGRLGRVVRATDPATKDMFASVAPPPALAGEAVIGPLGGTEGVEGVLILVVRPERTLEPHHLSLFEALLEPFSAALENDRRLHEMKTLREAAEADRRSLLARLGRRELTTTIVGAEAGLSHVMERVATVCPSDVPVLLLGDTGTGKEVIARAIHDRSPRHGGPFIRANCGAIPPELIDSQLFGHERGSFTGAVDTHQGWFERADCGTLFLDEIGELPPAAQVRLLRVLQDGFIERVGGRHSIHVDVRVVAATHRDLAAMVRERRFREDLWYRIAVFPIPIPPLRQRPEDIPALACHFAEKAATRFGLPLVMPTPEDMRLLAAYPWPGNVRELASVIDRAALLGNGRRLEVATSLGTSATLGVGDIGMSPIGASGGVSAASPSSSTDPPATVRPAAERPSRDATPSPAGASLDDAMRRHIESALLACHGRVEGPFGVARRLNINPHTLRARMRKLGINWRQFRSGPSPG